MKRDVFPIEPATRPFHTRWYARTAQGAFVALGAHPDVISAHHAAPVGVHALYDEETLRALRDSLTTLLGE